MVYRRSALVLSPEAEKPELHIREAGYQIVHALLLASPAMKHDDCQALFVVVVVVVVVELSVVDGDVL